MGADTAKKDEAKPTTLRMCAKCSDMCSLQLLDKNGKQIGERNDYVPRFFPGNHYGDYVMLDIDIETGKILNWKAPKAKELKEAFQEGEG